MERIIKVPKNVSRKQINSIIGITNKKLNKRLNVVIGKFLDKKIEGDNKEKPVGLLNRKVQNYDDYENVCLQCNNLEEQLDIANSRIKELEKDSLNDIVKQKTIIIENKKYNSQIVFSEDLEDINITTITNFKDQIDIQKYKCTKEFYNFSGDIKHMEYDTIRNKICFELEFDDVDEVNGLILKLNQMNNIRSSDISKSKNGMLEKVEHCIKNFNGKLEDCIAIGEMYRKYIEQNNMIDELVKYMASGKCYYGSEEEIREIFRKKVENRRINKI